MTEEGLPWSAVVGSPEYLSHFVSCFLALVAGLTVSAWGSAVMLAGVGRGIWLFFPVSGSGALACAGIVFSIGETRDVSDAAKSKEDVGVLIGETSPGPGADFGISLMSTSCGTVGDGCEYMEETVLLR